MNDNNKVAKFLLRAGLAFVYIYASIEIHISPNNFLKYIPATVSSVLPNNIFLPLFGIMEVVLAVWLLTGIKGVYPSILSVIMMVGIVVLNMEYFQVLFRNVAIAFGALALTFLEIANPNKEKSSTPQEKSSKSPALPHRL